MRIRVEQLGRDERVLRRVHDVDHGMIVMRGDLERRVQLRGRSTADHDGRAESRLLHLFRHMHHLLKRRRDEAREAEQVRLLLAHGLDDLLCRNHDAEVDHLVIVTCQHDGDDVFANVVHVTLHRGKDHLACLGGALRGRLFSLNGRLQNGHRLLHRARRLDHLRQEHLTGPKEFADTVHAVHQRPVDDGYGAVVSRERLGQIGLEEVADALQ